MMMDLNILVAPRPRQNLKLNVVWVSSPPQSTMKMMKKLTRDLKHIPKKNWTVRRLGTRSRKQSHSSNHPMTPTRKLLKKQPVEIPKLKKLELEQKVLKKSSVSCLQWQFWQFYGYLLQIYLKSGWQRIGRRLYMVFSNPIPQLRSLKDVVATSFSVLPHFAEEREWGLGL